MKKWLGYYIGFILLLLAGTAKVEAQIDPTLAGMILGYTNKAEKELKSQEKAMLMQTTGHLWMREEVEGRPICNGHSTTILIRSGISCAMRHKSMASTTR